LIGDRVKVADFGLVKGFDKANASGILGGVTPLYAPPETFLGKITPQSDEYSLAIVYQELLTGHRPYVAKNIRQMAQMHMQADPDLRSLPENERPIVARALSKDPTKRYPNCMSFIAALHKARAANRLVEVRQPGANGHKPKSLTETMEDIFLPAADSSVDLAGHKKKKKKPSSVALIELPEDEDRDIPDIEVSDLGVTIAQPENGSLRPTLIIGRR
jgi:serine/threonine protein kinase